MSEDNVEIVRRLYEHWARGDFAFSEPFDPKVEFSRTAPEGTGVSGRWRGLEEVWAGTVEFIGAFEEYRIEAERIIDVDDERVLVLSRHIGFGKRSGVPSEHELGDMITLRDGRIVGVDYYWERAEALEAAGPPAQAASDH